MQSQEEGISHRRTLLMLALLMLAAAAAAPTLAALQPRSLIPWAIVATLAIAATFHRPRVVDLFEPFTFLSWTHYAPAFVVGTWLLALGIVGYPYGGLVRDPTAACALALVYVLVGYLALGLGCRSRAAIRFGRKLAALLPAPPTEQPPPLAAVASLIALGLLASYGAFRSGILGFAIPRAPRPFDAAVSYAGVLLALGHFLFWHRWFDRHQARPSRWALALPLLVIVGAMVIWGNRGVLLSCYLVAALAFRAARGRLTVRQSAAAVALAFLALGVGMIYGSAFRRIRGGETGTAAAAAADAAADATARKEEPPPPALPSTLAPAAVAPEESAALSAKIPAPVSGSSGLSTPASSPVELPASPPPGAPTSLAATQVAPAPAAAIVPTSAPSLKRQLSAWASAGGALLREPRSAELRPILEGIGQRLNLLSDVSVTIARYPELRPLEASYGIVDLWTMTWTGFVPRALWPGKPRVSDARAYAALYFAWDGNSYATTPPADLIRNGGPLAIPLGMALFGLGLGALFTALAGEAKATGAERWALLAVLLSTVNLEGSYGLLLPTMLRVGLIAVVGLALSRLWSYSPRRADPSRR